MSEKMNEDDESSRILEENASNQLEASESAKIEKSKSAEEVASMISQQQQISFAKSNENLIVNSFVSFFEPLIQNLDTNVQALRYKDYLLS